MAINVTYRSYLRLPELLALQTPLTDAHDELLFISIHQASEIWLKLSLHELRAARAAVIADTLPPAFKMMSRVARIQTQLIQSWEVLATMTPADYTAMRGRLGTSSGFQSDQYRLVEFLLGAKRVDMVDIHAGEPAVADTLRDELHRPSLYDEALRLLARRGFAIPGAVTERDWTQAYDASPAVEAAWGAVYAEPDRYWDLYELAEKLVDIEYHVQLWRFGHLKTVERVIGFKTGTGGTAGVAYLAKVLDQGFFPELLSVRTAL
ncbi:tryptophan 2,3-dioxygenase family protein [Sphingomonas donggukensis]|uniref:Tryptophan 2,3-dioxygenase n=1 Tax=Sphingomonas donggukensis TaxID=2949093 RepID=A0ABY4TTZ4_9SPHN|nr:tryptophan 2,3-dioxygenase family protein [Sphingomonas donggukensis]URW74659.1 tryptophan 2,3-dioxygenase family protein [Sphingomonas donggukensis]